MHLVDAMSLPPGYTARPYAGRADHPAMVAVLGPYRAVLGEPDLPTVEQFDATYDHLSDCDPARDIALVLHDDDVVAYVRTSAEDMAAGTRDCILWAPTLPDHLAPELFAALADAQEHHMRPWADDVPAARYRADAAHPGPGRAPSGEAAWLEARGYTATEWNAALVRPHLDDIPDRSLPDGVELRPVADHQLRVIWEAHQEAFRGEWDFVEPTDEQYAEFLADPLRDTSLWKIAWVGDQVVGQVKSYVNPDENEARGYRRGYTEYISTHRDWRNRGIAGTLLALSLIELRERGFTEAALGADTNNPGGAFELYRKLGFEVRSHMVVYTAPVR